MRIWHRLPRSVLISISISICINVLAACGDGPKQMPADLRESELGDAGIRSDGSAPDPRPTHDAGPRAPDQSVPGRQTDQGIAAPTPTSPSVFLVVHLDPKEATVPNFQRMTALMAAVETRKAAGFNHRMTLLFTPEWGDFIAGDAARRQTVGAWVKAGHELGFHHHTAAHFNPDGYSDDPAQQDPMLCKNPSGCTVADAVDEIREMITHQDIGGTMKTAVVGPTDSSGKTYYDEFPADFLYAGAGYASDDGKQGWYANDPTNLLAGPQCQQPPLWPNVRPGNVKALSHMQFDVGSGKKNSVPLNAIEDAFDAAQNDDYVGVVWHSADYAATKGQPNIDALFDAMQARKLTSRTISELLGSPGCN